MAVAGFSFVVDSEEEDLELLELLFLFFGIVDQFSRNLSFFEFGFQFWMMMIFPRMVEM